MDAKPAAQKQPNPHDSFFKRLFGHPQITPELLMLALPEQDLLCLDLKRARLDKDTFPDGKMADLLLAVPIKGAPENCPWLSVLIEHKAEKIGRKAVWQLRGYQNSFIEDYFKKRGRLPGILSVFAHQGQKPFAPPAGLKRAGGGSADRAGPPAVPAAGYRECLEEDFFAKNPLTVWDFMIDFKMLVLDFIRGERVLSALREGALNCCPGLLLLRDIHEPRADDAAFVDRFFASLNDCFKSDEDLMLGASLYLEHGYGISLAVLKAAEERAVRDGILPKGGYMNVREEIAVRNRQEGRQEGRQEERRAVILNMLQKNLEIPFISEVTGLPEAEIIKFKNGEIKSPAPAGDQSRAKASNQNSKAE